MSTIDVSDTSMVRVEGGIDRGILVNYSQTRTHYNSGWQPSEGSSDKLQTKHLKGVLGVVASHGVCLDES